MKKVILSLVLTSLLVIPAIGFAAEQVPSGFCSFATGSADLNSILGRICGVVFGVGMFIVVVFIVIAGIYFVMAKGDPDKIKTARDFLLYAIIGAAVMFAAAAIIAFARYIGTG